MITTEQRCVDRAAEQISTMARVIQPFPKTAGWSRRAEDRQLRQMQTVFARHGGMLSGDEVARAMRHRTSQPISTIARWIVGREIAYLVVQSSYLLPMFQFDLVTFTWRPGLREAVLELRDALDAWEICLWFASPHSGLDGATPADRLADDPDSVVRVARTDRAFGWSHRLEQS